MNTSTRSYTTRSSCRVCGSLRLTNLFSLGDQYVSNFVDNDSDPGIKCPIDIVMCQDCTLVQQRHSAPQDFLYSRFYWYRSGVTETMRDALKAVTHAIESLVELKPGDVALDIGSNDGTLLRSYNVPGLVTVGVEPANNLIEEGSKGLSHFVHDFWNYHAYREVVGRQAKVITALGMFYDLEDPNQFIRDVARALAPDGIFVAQLMCLRNMLDIGDVGNLCHEHLEFYSLISLKRLFAAHGLELIDVQSNQINGSSYRLYVKHYKAKVYPFSGADSRMLDYQHREEGLSEPEFYRHFYQRMESNKNKVKEFVKAVVESGKTVYVYGASTKGNVLLQYYGLDSSLITAAADRSPEKWGKYTVGTNIPIVSNDEARTANPDYFLVLPYAFISEFMEIEKSWHDDGGRFIVPLPEMRIV